MAVELKATTPEDYSEYYRIRCSPSDIYWNGYKSAPNKENFRMLFLRRLGNAPIEKAEDRRLYLIQVKDLGSVGFTQIIKRDDGMVISYTVIEEYQRKGYATEALKKTIEIAKQFDDIVYVQIRDDNIGSQKVAVRCGFRRTDEFEEREYPEVGKVKLRKYRLMCKCI